MSHIHTTGGPDKCQDNRCQTIPHISMLIWGIYAFYQRFKNSRPLRGYLFFGKCGSHDGPLVVKMNQDLKWRLGMELAALQVTLQITSATMPAISQYFGKQ